MGKLVKRYHISVEFIEGEPKYYEATEYKIDDSILWIALNGGNICINIHAVKQFIIQEVHIDPTTIENN